MLAMFQHLPKVGCHLLAEVQINLKAVTNESGDLLNDTPTSLPSPYAEMAMSCVVILML